MTALLREKSISAGSRRSRVSGHAGNSLLSRTASLFAVMVFLVGPSFAAEFVVSSAAQIAQVMTTAQPGDTLTMTNGTWTNQQILFQGSGASGNPIVLRAQSYGTVTLSGTSKLKIAGNYLVAENLVFQNGNCAPDPVVEFRNGSNESNYCRLTRSSISNYSPADINTDNKWVSLYGSYNRVDHCALSGKTNSGTTLVVWLTDHPNYHLIDYNYFGPRPNLGFNGGETIRVGTSDWSMYDSFTIVEYNLFDRCDGELETISSKSCGNVYRYNTFTSCQGTLTLRHGNRCTVEGNFFFGNGVPNSGGIRIIGEDHNVFNNYIAGTTGNGTRSALTLMNGVPNSPLNRYFQVKRALVAFNTLIDNQTTLTIGAGADSELTLPPLDCTITNTVLYGTHSPFVTQVAAPINMTYQGNIYYGATLGIAASGFLNVDPALTPADSDGLRHINSNSPAINTSLGSYTLVVSDMDGQARDSLRDSGADEFSFAAITRRPLTAADVGPTSGTTYTITATAAAAANGTISPNGAVTVDQGATQTFTITPAALHHVDSLLVDEVPVDSTTSYTFTNVTTSHTIRAVFRINSTTTLGVSLAGGWTLISDPVTDPTPGDSVGQLYPTSLYPYAFEFSSDGGYVQQHTLANGKGYWEKFPAAISHAVTGSPRTLDSISVAPGWNIVGTISCPVDTSTIVSVPAHLKGSHWFGYAAGYTPVTQLVPGHGYWVKANAVGKFVLACPPGTPNAKTSGAFQSAQDAAGEGGEDMPTHRK